jgi:hypothetical protein
VTRRRLARALALGALLIVATSACQLDISATTSVNRDGSGRFALRFVVDKELSDLARNTGQDTLRTLCDVSEDLSARGWSVNRSTAGGGLTLELERAFSSPDDLLSTCLSLKPGAGTRFFDIHVRHSSSFLKTSTTVSGSVDLTGAGLLAQSNFDDATKKQLQSFIEQTGNQFFSFALGARLPGGVSATEGGAVVKGGAVSWSPQLGKKLSFEASSSSYTPTTLGILIGAIAGVAGIVAVTVIRRRAPG